MSSEVSISVELRQVVEALLFATTKPLSARQIASLLNKSTETNGPFYALFRDVPETTVEETIAALRDEYAHSPRGVRIQEIAGGYRFGTLPETATWVRQLFDETRPTKLSQPALETLAIVAYRQPISRADIEAVRGVAVDGVVTTLLERKLIKLAGRSDAPGRPLLYETTTEFLETFGLKGLDELPNADELRRIALPKSAAPVNPMTNDTAPAHAAGPEPEAELGLPNETAAPETAESENHSNRSSDPEWAAEAPSET